MIYHSRNSQDRPRTLEQNFKPSLTEPDHSLTPREIIKRSQQGLINNIQKPQLFTGDMPDLRGLDFVELEAIKQQANDLEKQTNEKLRKAIDERNQRDLLEKQTTSNVGNV